MSIDHRITTGIAKEYDPRKFLYLTRTSGVTSEEYAAVDKGVKKILDEVKSTVSLKNFENFFVHDREYGSADWYQGQCLMNQDTGAGQQVNAYPLLNLLDTEPWQQQERHQDLFIIDKDLTLPDTNFLFGVSRHPNNVVSVARFRLWIRDKLLRHDALAILTAHELGHGFGLVRRNWDQDHGFLRDQHCAHASQPCLMEQVNVSGKLPVDQQARKLIGREKWLCSSCEEEIQKRREHFQHLNIPW